MTLGSTQHLTETSTTEVPGSKGSRCVGLTTLPTFMCWLSGNSGSCTQPPRTVRAYPGPYRNSCTFTFIFYTVADMAVILIMCSTIKGSTQQKLHTNNQLTVNTKKKYINFAHPKLHIIENEVKQFFFVHPTTLYGFLTSPPDLSITTFVQLFTPSTGISFRTLSHHLFRGHLK